jgi:hypothetical protein
LECGLQRREDSGRDSLQKEESCETPAITETGLVL